MGPIGESVIAFQLPSMGASRPSLPRPFFHAAISVPFRILFRRTRYRPDVAVGILELAVLHAPELLLERHDCFAAGFNRAVPPRIGVVGFDVDDSRGHGLW